MNFICIFVRDGFDIVIVFMIVVERIELCIVCFLCV